MRLPFTKVYRGFPEFDALPDEDCERYVRSVRATRPGLVNTVPLATALTLLVLWPAAWCGLWTWDEDLVLAWVPLPPSDDMRVVLLAGTTLLVPVLSALLLRDAALWWGVRQEVNRARCPKCRQSLLGVPVQEVGVGGDPAKRFIRCPECGRRYMLLEIGITPRDLVPFEQRAVSPGFASHRR
jgi:hypothetical protein